MKKQALPFAFVLLLVGLIACDTEIDKVFDEQTLVEFDAAVLTAPAAGRTYPLISIPANTTAPTTVSTRLNLVGAQRGSDLTVRVLPDPTATTASASNYTLANGGNVTIPANSSFGSLSITVGRASSTTAPTANLVLVLDSTSTDFKPSQNFRRLGYTFRN